MPKTMFTKGEGRSKCLTSSDSEEKNVVGESCNEIQKEIILKQDVRHKTTGFKPLI